MATYLLGELLRGHACHTTPRLKKHTNDESKASERSGALLIVATPMTMYDMELFRSLLTRECAKRKLLAVAIDMKLSVSAVSYHCKGQRTPDNDKMQRYAHVLGIPEECLIIGTDEHMITRQIEEQRGFVALSKTKNHHEDDAVRTEKYLRPIDRVPR